MRYVLPNYQNIFKWGVKNKKMGENGFGEACLSVPASPSKPRQAPPGHPRCRAPAAEGVAHSRTLPAPAL